jgi:hypothetical protein
MSFMFALSRWRCGFTDRQESRNAHWHRAGSREGNDYSIANPEAAVLITWNPRTGFDTALRGI